MIENIALIKKYAASGKELLLYGLNEEQRAFYTLLRGEEILKEDAIRIVDPVAEGYFHNRIIEKPTKENLAGRNMIVFDECSFSDLDQDIIASLKTWVRYKELLASLE